MVPSRGYQVARNSTNRSHNRSRSASPGAAVRLRKYRQKGQNCTHLTGPSTDVTGRRRGVRLALTPTGKLGRPVVAHTGYACDRDSTRDMTRREPTPSTRRPPQATGSLAGSYPPRQNARSPQKGRSLQRPKSPTVRPCCPFLFNSVGADPSQVVGLNTDRQRLTPPRSPNTGDTPGPPAAPPAPGWTLRPPPFNPTLPRSGCWHPTTRRCPRASRNRCLLTP